MGEKIKVAFPPKFCDYWWGAPKIWDGKKPVECECCSESISKGEEYFEIAVEEDDIKRGHLHHLEYAETIEWVPKESPE